MQLRSHFIPKAPALAGLVVGWWMSPGFFPGIDQVTEGASHYQQLGLLVALSLVRELGPVVAGLLGKDLLPSYCYFRIYRQGDICKVHGDRPACEHSLSLTLDYSDGAPWALDVSPEPVEPSPRSRRSSSWDCRRLRSTWLTARRT